MESTWNLLDRRHLRGSSVEIVHSDKTQSLFFHVFDHIVHLGLSESIYVIYYIMPVLFNTVNMLQGLVSRLVLKSPLLW